MYQKSESLDGSELAKLAIDSMVDHAVYILDLVGTIISSSAGARNIMGYRSNEIVGHHVACLYTMDAIERKHPEYEMEQSRYFGRYQDEEWCVRKDGSQFWANISINRLETTAGHIVGFSMIIRDLTLKKRREEKLIHSKISALRALKLKSQFIADISHEIRSPLGAMLGFAEFLQKENINKEERNRYLDIILRNGKNLNRVINDVLDLSKIEAGKIDIELAPLNLDKTITEVIELFYVQAAQKGVSLIYHPGQIDHEEIVSDAHRLQQILINLIGNALKFTEKGCISISVEKNNETSEKSQWRILVKDSGIGLSAEEATKIFHPYVQVDKCQSRSRRGSGLGLILSRKIAEALGGSVELMSTALGVGSVFGINFLNYKAFKIPQKVKPTQDLAPLCLENKSILIVDDSEDNLEIINLFLSSYGGETDVALDGHEALKKLQSKRYDVILMDIEMPIMNGFQLIKELKKIKNKTPVIALTAHAMPEDKLKTKNAGFFAHISKPIDFNHLVTVVKEA